MWPNSERSDRAPNLFEVQQTVSAHSSSYIPKACPSSPAMNVITDPGEHTRPEAVGREGKTIFREDYRRAMEQPESDQEDGKKGLDMDRNPSPPLRWAKSLQNLLEDGNGVVLFEQFLTQEGQDNKPLVFWFACQGVKRRDPNEKKEKLCKLINLIFEKQVRRISCISDATKTDIHKRLQNNESLDCSVFDKAQEEVEKYMLQTTYPNFLSSELYLRQLGSANALNEESTQALPTVHEDSELTLSAAAIKGLKENFMNRRRMTLNRAKQEAGAYIKSPYSVNSNTYSSYHTKYASYLPASAQDSELQSLSSEAQTDDTMSQTDNSSVDFPIHSRKQKRQLRPKYSNAVINRERSGDNGFIPRTQRDLSELSQGIASTNPEEFHAEVVKKLTCFLEEQRTKEKVNERLKAIESCDPPKHTADVTAKSSICAPPSHQGLLGFCGPSEDNVQDILDQHVSRVFEGPTPTLSPACASPRNLPFTCTSENPAMDLSKPAAGILYTNRYKREHDTRSNADSGALTDWISEEHLASSQYQHSSTEELSRLRRDQLRRHAAKKQLSSGVTDSGSSCVDSGISGVWEHSHSKVHQWLETKRSTEYEKEHMWKTSSTSPVLSRSSSTRKAAYCRNSMGMEGYLAPEPSTANTTNNLMEARRRLEDDPPRLLKNTKAKYVSGGRSSHDNLRGKVSSRTCESFEDGISHRKQSKKSNPSSGMVDSYSASNSISASVSSNSNEVTTVIGYSYGHGSVPYKTRLPGKNITLRQFKSLLSKKGNFRYFFKQVSDDFGTGVVLGEVVEDYEILPLWEGKVFCVIESMEDSSNTNDC